MKTTKGTPPRVASLWQRKDQPSGAEVVMVTSVTPDKDGALIVGFAPVDRPTGSTLQTRQALTLFLDWFELVPVGLARREPKPTKPRGRAVAQRVAQ